jgi:hypothetical protein
MNLFMTWYRNLGQVHEVLTNENAANFTMEKVNLDLAHVKIIIMMNILQQLCVQYSMLIS